MSISQRNLYVPYLVIRKMHPTRACPALPSVTSILAANITLIKLWGVGNNALLAFLHTGRVGLCRAAYLTTPSPITLHKVQFNGCGCGLSGGHMRGTLAAGCGATTTIVGSPKPQIRIIVRATCQAYLAAWAATSGSQNNQESSHPRSAHRMAGFWDKLATAGPGGS